MDKEPDFQKMNGLVPVIVQDHATGKVLMLAYLNKEAWELSLQTKEAHFYSRSRHKIWHKGETSGNVQRIKEVFLDCDQDTVLFKVEQVGGACCHEGYASCFYRRLQGDGFEVVEERIFDPKKVYGT